jgi:hypothetical protein
MPRKIDPDHAIHREINATIGVAPGAGSGAGLEHRLEPVSKMGWAAGSAGGTLEVTWNTQIQRCWRRE